MKHGRQLRRRSNPRRRERGVALLIVLVALVIVETAGALLAAGLAHESRLHQQEVQRARLDLLLDSAVASTLAHLAQAPGYGGLAAQAFADGEIESQVEPRDGGGLRALVRARLAGSEHAAELELVLSAAGPRIVSWHSLGIGPLAEGSGFTK